MAVRLRMVVVSYSGNLDGAGDDLDHDGVNSHADDGFLNDVDDLGDDPHARSMYVVVQNGNKLA